MDFLWIEYIMILLTLLLENSMGTDNKTITERQNDYNPRKRADGGIYYGSDPVLYEEPHYQKPVLEKARFRESELPEFFDYDSEDWLESASINLTSSDPGTRSEFDRSNIDMDSSSATINFDLPMKKIKPKNRKKAPWMRHPLDREEETIREWLKLSPYQKDIMSGFGHSLEKGPSFIIGSDINFEPSSRRYRNNLSDRTLEKHGNNTNSHNLFLNQDMKMDIPFGDFGEESRSAHGFNQQGNPRAGAKSWSRRKYQNTHIPPASRYEKRNKDPRLSHELRRKDNQNHMHHFRIPTENGTDAQNHVKNFSMDGRPTKPQQIKERRENKWYVNARHDKITPTIHYPINTKSNQHKFPMTKLREPKTHMPSTMPGPTQKSHTAGGKHNFRKFKREMLKNLHQPFFNQKVPRQKQGDHTGKNNRDLNLQPQKNYLVNHHMQNNGNHDNAPRTSWDIKYEQERPQNKQYPQDHYKVRYENKWDNNGPQAKSWYYASNGNKNDKTHVQPWIYEANTIEKPLSNNYLSDKHNSDYKNILDYNTPTQMAERVSYPKQIQYNRGYDNNWEYSIPQTHQSTGDFYPTDNVNTDYKSKWGYNAPTSPKTIPQNVVHFSGEKPIETSYGRSYDGYYSKRDSSHPGYPGMARTIYSYPYHEHVQQPGNYYTYRTAPYTPPSNYIPEGKSGPNEYGQSFGNYYSADSYRPTSGYAEYSQGTSYPSNTERYPGSNYSYDKNNPMDFTANSDNDFLLHGQALRKYLEFLREGLSSEGTSGERRSSVESREASLRGKSSEEFSSSSSSESNSKENSFEDHTFKYSRQRRKKVNPRTKHRKSGTSVQSKVLHQTDEQGTKTQDSNKLPLWDDYLDEQLGQLVEYISRQNRKPLQGKRSGVLSHQTSSGEIVNELHENPESEQKYRNIFGKILKDSSDRTFIKKREYTSQGQTSPNYLNDVGLQIVSSSTKYHSALNEIDKLINSIKKKAEQTLDKYKTKSEKSERSSHRKKKNSLFENDWNSYKF